MLNLTEEKALFAAGYRLIGALDEAGRGPLAGPVVAACVLVNPDFQLNDERLKLVNDSKKLSEKKREELFDLIYGQFSVGVGITDHETIDRINILEATFLSMKKAVGSLRDKPDVLLVDGKMTIPNTSFAQKAIVDGDALVFSIAAASIVAKVTRDRIMVKMHDKFPQYAFNLHKGYGTKLHLERIQEFGPCQIHRKTFAPIKKCLLNNPKSSIIKS